MIDLVSILLQDAVILLAGFLAEFTYEHWLHSTHPFFRLATSLSSALFLLLYGITVTVHLALAPHNLDVADAGRRFLVMLTPRATGESAPITIVVNWKSGLSLPR